MNINIGLMTPDDLDDIMEIEQKCFSIPWTRASFEQEFNNKMAVYFVARLNGKAIGYGGMWKVLDEGHITNIAVHPDFRRLKVGSAIMNTLVEFAGNHGINRITLEVRVSNIAAQNLYRKFGFKAEGRRKAYYADNNEDALIMSYYKS